MTPHHNHDQSMGSIGSELLNHAEGLEEPIRLPLTTQLFPYLFLASRKMTTREMSAWLDQTKGIKLSGVAISKGLKRPELHLRRIADFIQFPAAFLGSLYRWDMELLLFEEDERTGKSQLTLLAENIFNDPDAPSKDVISALETLQTIWAPIPQEVKYMCRRYFDFASDSGDDNQDEDLPNQPK
jgi:hypothetical protein